MCHDPGFNHTIEIHYRKFSHTTTQTNTFISNVRNLNFSQIRQAEKVI